MALKMQEKLLGLVGNQNNEASSSNGQINGENDDEIEDEEGDYDEEDDDGEDEEEEDEEGNEEDEEEKDGTDYSGSLLHSILTHGRQQMNREGSSSGAEVTEVEVRIDPMLFLSGQDDNSEDMDDSEPPQSSKDQVNGSGDTKEAKPYQCTVCPRGFNSEISLQNHLWSHLSRKVLSDTDLNSRLRSHKKGSVFSSNGVLHTIRDLPLTHPYLCPICGRQISTKGNLKVHLETHRPKGKYDCDICGRIFKTQSNLYRHKEYHGGVQFTCEVCARVYPTKSTLRAHSITHSDLRPHQCPLCDKTFKRNQDLKFHINQHTGARPYKCPFCPKAFASSGNCFSHRKRMHPSELEKYKEMTNGYVQ
ncbi:hypothetical protein J6590_023383 [Homalodisca vitripennis]|nr:hypothetical protein J6590_023383 [Homalodisca vitripennis]